MQANPERIHTTLNLSKPLIREARRLFKGKTNTEIIHEALERWIRMNKLERHIKKWAGKGRFRSYG